MSNSFTSSYVAEDRKTTRLHFQHPILNTNTGRTEDQIKAENDFHNNRPSINPKTGGRR